MANKRKSTIIPVDSYRGVEKPKQVRPGDFSRMVRDIMSRGTNMQDFVQLIFHRAIASGDPYAVKLLVDSLESTALSDRVKTLCEEDYKDILSHVRSLVERERELTGKDAVDAEYTE